MSIDTSVPRTQFTVFFFTIVFKFDINISIRDILDEFICRKNQIILFTPTLHFGQFPSNFWF